MRIRPAFVWTLIALFSFAAVGPKAQRGASGVLLSGAHVLNAAGDAFVDASVIVRDGRVAIVSPTTNARSGRGFTTEVVSNIQDLSGRYLIPGLISAHAHVSDVDGLKARAYTPENTARQLGVFARYGITTVFSLGGEQAPAFSAREAQANFATLNHARIFLAGDVITGATPEAARQAVARVAALKPDIIKIRVDDNLGAATKMAPEVYKAVIDEAHTRGLRVAVHIFYLEDAKAVLKAGADMIAHSVRDLDIDAEFISLMKARNIPYCPTLTREISTFIYESTPSFFSDPFFLNEADSAMVAQLKEPARQASMKASATAQRYKAGLEIAKRNLKKASDAGLLIVMGTDSGAFPERFEGYFEHLEMQMMVESGLTPRQVLQSATVNAARAIGAKDIGAIAPGNWADFVVLDKNPFEDIKNTRAMSSVWVGGNTIKR